MKKISVLIITRNRSFILPDCLKSLQPEITEEHEVIVVDSSTDGQTQSLIRHYPWVRYKRVFLPPGTRPQSYSLAAQMAVGEIVALLDDDAIVHPGWLKNLYDCYRDPQVGAAGGRILAPETDLNVDCRSAVSAPAEGGETPPLQPVGLVTSKGKFFSNFYQDTAARLQVDSLRGSNMSVRSKLLRQMNYFDARFRGQNCRVEDDICFWIKRMGYAVVFEPKAVVTHLAEERPDIPRSEFNMRSEFYVWRNTAWLFVKHRGWKAGSLFNIAFLLPFTNGIRRVLGGSFKRFGISRQSLRYFPAACAGLAGGLWGIFVSLFYKRPESKWDLIEGFLGDKARRPGVQVHEYHWPRAEGSILVTEIKMKEAS